MIEPGVLSVEPWAVAERSLRLDLLAQTETIFALSNGHIGLRGNLDEGEPHVIPGTYLNGFFEAVPLPYAEQLSRASKPNAQDLKDAIDRVLEGGKRWRK